MSDLQVAQADPLVPLLPLEGSAPDPVALGTWYLALSATTAETVPHDLFALWLFPDSGGVVLLGPEALSQDAVQVPIPDPYLLQDQLFQLEQVLRRAKYGSAIAVPVKLVGRDVAVMLLGSFSRGAYGPVQALALKRLSRSLTTSLAALAEVMPSAAPHSALEPAMTREDLPGHIARAAAECASGPDLVRRVSGVIYPLLPHDRLEILACGTMPGTVVALSGNAPKKSSRVGTAFEPFTEIISRFGDVATLLLDDLTELPGDCDWPIGGGASAPQPARAVLGARLQVAGQTVGYLLIASVAPHAYHPDDEDSLAMAGLLVATRVAGFRLAAEVGALQSEIETADLPALPLIRAAEALAVTGQLQEALRRFSEGLGGLLPHERITLHLRWGEDEVIELNPDSPRPFADIPAIDAGSFAGAPVLRGEQEWTVRLVDGCKELIVPLAVAGRAVGTLGVRARSFSSHDDAAAVALQFANILAPHLELLRRGASAGMSPGVRSSKAPAAVER
ncbi:MAG TPA: hypothetical protein VFU23_06550 [Gemmatimonadales bacterium]|nr:hypothetical protein [Gemmatimonadales bacterium]